MDGSKTYARDDDQQTGLLKIAKTFSNDIQLECGLGKCAKASFNGGKLTETSDVQIHSNFQGVVLTPKMELKF